jgi:hypothetical protein
MRRVEILLLMFAFSDCFLVNMKAQSEPELSSRIIEYLKVKEPDWKAVGGIGGHVPLVPNEKRILGASWEKPSSHGALEVVQVFIYGVETRVDAVEWLKRIRSGQVAPGWQTDVFQIGDEAVLAKYKDGKRFEIHFRKGHVVGSIAANHLSRAAEFAKNIVEQIPAN